MSALNNDYNNNRGKACHDMHPCVGNLQEPVINLPALAK